jgi:hypothetical protein
MRIGSILIAAILALVVLAGPALAQGKGHGGTNRFGATNAQECADDARNHGQYVSCITSLVRAAGSDVKAADLGLDSDCDSAESLITCAAHSHVGKPKKGNDD